MRKILLIVILFASISLFAQTSGEPSRNYNIIPYSPTVSQIMRYDDMPVSEYTGVPRIDVPLYSIQEDEMKLDLSLVYHAGGIKVNQESSWVGLGWDLRLPSVIQVINGVDDFRGEESSGFERYLPDYFQGSMSSNYGYEKYPTSPQSSAILNWPQDSPNTSPNRSTPQLGYNYWLTIDAYFSINGIKKKHSNGYFSTGNKDSEPDIFKVDLFGDKLTFILYNNTNNNLFIILNKKGYYIDRTQNIWTITNPKGQKFIFRDSATSTISTSSNGTSNSSLYKTHPSRIWMLNKIITEKGKEIIINYQKTKTEIESVSFNESQDFFESSITTRRLGPWDFYSDFVTKYPTENKITTTNKVYEYQYYIESIIFPKGKVQFYLSDRQDIVEAKKLSRMTVSNSQNEIVKDIDFTYDYFVEKNNAGKRLKLETVLKDKNEGFIFIYNNKQLPAKISYEQDYWGYCNGKVSNKSLIPNPQRFNNVYKDNGENHSANLQFTKTAVLETIKYPTGGSVSFDYELNTFNNCWVPDIDSINNKISKGFGLRVKSIVHKDISDKIIKRVFYQYDGGKANIKQYMIMKNLIRRYALSGKNAPYTVDEVRVINVTSNGYLASNPLASMNGVGYEKVTKQYIDNTNTTGKTITYYNNNPDVTPPHASDTDNMGKVANGGAATNMTIYIPLPAHKNVEFPENGTIKRVCFYDKSNRLIKEQLFEYKNMLSGLYYGAVMDSYSGYYVHMPLTGTETADFVGYVYLIGYYPIIDFESLMTSKLEKEYDGDFVITKEESYKYEDKYRLMNYKIIKRDSRGYSNHTFQYKYPHDFVSGNNIYRQMVDKNMIYPVIETKETNYKGNDINHQKFNYIEINNITLPSSIETKQKTNSEYTTDIKYEKYDNKGNLLQYTALDGIITVLLWSYNGQYPIAEIKGATYDQIKGVLTESVIDRLSASIEPSESDLKKLNDLRSNVSLGNIMVTAYTHKPLVGMTSATDPSGKTTYYEYDSFNRLKRTYIKERSSNSIEVEQTLQSHDYHYSNQ